ncbi:MAG: hypothetical protein QOI76_2035 [Frankiales bacterium]|nr:hypothetical protein [Frankiales bacterium]
MHGIAATRASSPLSVPAGWVPLRRFAVMGAAAVALGAVQLPNRPHTLCLLRAVTGIPCPLCGGTTAAVRVGQGHLAAGLAANPLAFFGAIALVLAGLPMGRRAVAVWRSQSPSVRVLLGTAVLAAGECWQLARFGLF